MEAEVEIQEPFQETQQQPDPPRKKLWNLMRTKQLYTKSYEDFDKQFSTPESIDRLHKFLGEKQLYTKTTQDFQNQFFSDRQPTVKKKVGSIGLDESSLQAGNSLSTGVGSEEIPQIEMYTTPSGEMVETDPISLSKKYNELKNKTILHRTGGEGTASQFLPDENARKEADKLQEDFKDFDLHGIYEETKDLNDEILAGHGKRLMQERKENPQLYQRDIANLKWRSGFEKQLLNEVDKGSIDPDNYNRIKHSIDTLPEFTGQGDYSNQRLAIQSLSKDIQLYGGENKEKLLKDFAVEVSKVYGNAYNNNLDKSLSDTPESKYMTPEAQLGYQYIQDVSPDKAEQYKRLLIDPKTLKDKPDEQKGYNHLMQTLEETGIGLEQNSVSEELNNLKAIAERNNGLTPEQIQKATELEKKQDELIQKRDELDKKYPDRISNKVSDAVNEIMGHDLNWGEYAMVKTGQALKHTGEGIWQAVSSPFMSDASNNLRELAIMGESITDEANLKQPDKNRNLLYDKFIIEPDLKKQADEIKNDKGLNDEQKRSKLFSLFYNNRDKFGRVPIQNGKFNINPSSILYGVTDLATGILPFVGIEMATGGIGGAGAAAKFIRTFTAAAATTFHDEYAGALMEGKTQSDAYKSAMASTAINSMAMAGAGTPTAIKEMAAGMKTSASKIIAQMSEAEIQKVLAKGTPKGLKAFGQSLKERGKAIPSMVWQGLKTGAKFEAYMTGANILNDREVNFKQVLINTANFGLLGAGLGQIGFKSPTELQKSHGLEFGKNPDEYIQVAKEMKKNGQLSESELNHRIDLIERYGEAYKTLPKANAKGNPLTEKQKADYLYNSVIKNEGNKAKSNLPPKQAELAEHTALVADYANDYILDPKTDKQLEEIKGVLERKIEPKKDAEGNEIKIPEQELKHYKAELEAVNNQIEFNSRYEKITNPEIKEEKKDEPIAEVVTEKIEVPITQEEGSIATPELSEVTLKTKEGEIGQPPKEPVVEEVAVEESLPERRFTKQMLRSDDLSDASKGEIAKTLNYVAESREMTLKEANDVIDKVGLDEAQNLVISDTKLEPAVRNAVGMTLIKKFNELSEKSATPEEKNYYLDKSIQTATSITERATLEGRGIDIFNVWARLSPEGQLRAANQDMAAQGKEKLRRREKDINKIGKEFQKANEEAAEEVTKSSKVKTKPKSASEKISDIEKKREQIRNKYKGNKGKNLYSGVGLTKEGIEYVGEMTATYIQEGVYKIEIIVEKIIKELKGLTGKVPDEAVRKNVEYVVKEKFSEAKIKPEENQVGDKEKISKAFVSLEDKINKIIKEHYTIPDATKKKLIDKFVEEAGLDKAEAAKLAKEVEAEFDRIATRKKRNILYNEKARFDKINKTLQGSKKVEKKTLADEIIKYSNLGAFEGKEFADMIANKFGIGEISPEQAAKLLELAKKVEKAPEGTPKNNATEDLLSYRANLRGNDLGETAQAVWYANVLSGYKTHEKNLISTFFNSMGELGAEMAKDPKSIPHLIAGYIKGLSTRGRIEAAHTIKTGYSPIHIKKIDVPNVLERKSFKGGAINPGNWFKYVMRMMVAEDVFLFQGLKEARAYQLARREVSKEGFNTWSKKGWDRVNEVLLHTKERYATALDTITKEGLLNKKDKPTLEGKRRIYELMENSRPEKMVDDSYGFAAHGTFNHESEGSLGAITNAVAAGLDAVSIGSFKPARLVVPFTRIITNVVNNSLDFTPVGLIRAARGVRGFRSFEKSPVTKKAFKELSREERQRLIAKASLGITLAATFQAMHQAGTIQITGGGTGDNKKDEQLRQSGWQEYSVKIGNKYYSYKYTPLVFMLGFLGNMNDAAKYGDEDEQTTIKKMQIAASRVGGQVVDMTWINSASTFLGSLAEKNTDRQGSQVGKALVGMGRGFIPFSGAIMQATQAMNGIFGANKKQTDGAFQALMASLPIARNSYNDKINALGEPIGVNENTSWYLPDFISKEKSDEVWKLLNDKQGWVAPVNKDTIIVFDQNTQEDRPITGDEYYTFSKKRGERISAVLKEAIKQGEFIDWNTGETYKIKDVSSKDFNKWLTKVESKATKETKAEMFGEAPEKETKDLDINQ